MIVLKIIGWTLLGLIALVVILLHFSVRVYVKGGTDGTFVYKVSYLFFTIFPRPEKKPKEEHSEDAPQPEEPKDEPEDEPPDIEDTQEEEPPPEETPEEPQDLPAQTEAEEKPPETLTDPADQSQTEDTPEDKPDEHDKKKKKDKKSKKEDSSNKEQPSKLQELKEKYLFIKPFIPLGWRYFRRLLKAIRITGLRVNILTGKEDAYEAAMAYGKLQTAVMSGLTLLCGIFTVKIKEANVYCNFIEKRFDAEGEATVKVRPSTMIHIGFCLGLNALILFIKQKLRQRRARKQAAKKAEKAQNSKENVKQDGEKAA